MLTIREILDHELGRVQSTTIDVKTCSANEIFAFYLEKMPPLKTIATVQERVALIEATKNRILTGDYVTLLVDPMLEANKRRGPKDDKIVVVVVGYYESPAVFTRTSLSIDYREAPEVEPAKSKKG